VTVVGLDDTDSRERGMCTTYVAARIAERIREAGGAVQRRLLVRLNPAVEHKTRGNAALAVHTDLAADEAFGVAAAELDRLAVLADARTSPGLVVADCAPGDVPDRVARFARAALRRRLDLADALAVLDPLADDGWRHAGRAGEGCPVAGRGRIGALAAVGAWRGLDDWTYERISYRALDRCGSPREVDRDSVFAAADWGYPVVWDTVDRGERAAVCVPAAPGPILHGIRGDDPAACRAVVGRIESEPVDRAATFVTNQGTDAHLGAGTVGRLRDGAGYRVDGVVAADPETRRGGHVAFGLVRPDPGRDAAVACVAFEPTKRFRDRVRGLRAGDRLTVCGEHEAGGGRPDGVAGEAAGTVKLEKFAARALVTTERVTPTCPGCDRSMESAGRGQGYRCRDCGTSAPGPVERRIDRDLDPGWYEVPPCARRHVAKPLVRGGFDAPTHPER